MTFETFTFTYTRVRLAKLEAESYNRPLDEKRVELMAAEWNELLLQALTVVKVGKRLILIDGQHRVAAGKHLGKREMWAQVFTGVDAFTDRAQMYYDLQQERKALSAYDAFVGLLAAEHPDAMSMQRIVEGHGLKFARGETKGAIKAVAACRAAWRASSPKGEAFDNALRLLSTEWVVHEHLKCLDGDLIKGLARVFVVRPDVDTLRLRNKMKATVPEAILQEARLEAQLGSRSGEGTAYAVARVFISHYNKGLNGSASTRIQLAPRRKAA